MSLKILGRLEEHAFFILFMAFILIMLWHGIWGLADSFEQYLHERYGFKKIHFNLTTVLGVVLIIGLFPQILEKL
jgi:succinate dehydrogenase hydrophobic anchor subunit